MQASLLFREAQPAGRYAVTTRERLFLLYLGDTQPTKYWAIWVALFAAMGLMLRAGDSGHPDTDLLIDLMPGWAWMLLLVYMMATRTITILWRSGTVWTRIRHNRIMSRVEIIIGDQPRFITF